MRIWNMLQGDEAHCAGTAFYLLKMYRPLVDEVVGDDEDEARSVATSSCAASMQTPISQGTGAGTRALIVTMHSYGVFF